MFYILTNIFACLNIIILFYIGIILDYKNFKKINILIITITSLLITLSVILTNIISYSITFPFFIKGGSIKLALGNFLIFVVGMLFGPFLGILSGIASDILGTLTNISGIYHSGFSFNLVLYGFLGSMVFLFKNNKFWILKTIILYIIGFGLISFVFNVLWLYSLGLKEVILPIVFIIKIIKFPIQLLVYLFMVISSFIVLYKLIIFRHNITLWCTKKNIFINFDKNKKNKKYIYS